MLITIRRRWLLRLFGWGLYMGKPRKPEEYPSKVTASVGLWWFWFRRGANPVELNEGALRHSKIEI